MTRGIRKLEIVLATFAVAFYLLCIASAFGAERARIKPHDLAPEKRNGDYLNKIASAPREASLNQQIFEQPVADEMSSRFSSMYSPYQLRQSYQLNDFGDDIRYQQSNKQLADWTLRRLVQYHLNHTVTKKVEKGARRAVKESKSPEAKAAASTALVISEIHRAIQNTTLNLGENLKTRFRYDLPSGLMSLKLTSPLLEANMDYSTRSVQQDFGTVGQSERLSLTMNKKIDIVEADTSVKYGLLSETLVYGVNRQLFGPVSAQVDQAKYFRDPSRDETVFRLNLGTKF